MPRLPVWKTWFCFADTSALSVVRDAIAISLQDGYSDTSTKADSASR
jgi:hypothetical protein